MRFWNHAVTALSPQQQTVVERPAGKLCVTACAGSGKTRTVVHRVEHLSRLLSEQRGRIALLSYSNVAVETFQKDYQALLRTRPTATRRCEVEIATLDSFFGSNVLGPHAHRAMGTDRRSYLVSDEPFLKGFTFKAGSFPMAAKELKASISRGEIVYWASYKSNKIAVAESEGAKLMGKLAKVGAYTHDLGRYWVYKTLKEHPFVLRALARRYPQILIDEAQDIGSCHQAILELLDGSGSQISLIGDANQGIYEFADADGAYLRSYHAAPGIDARELTRNYRSVPAIVDVANKLTGRADEWDREAPATVNGAFFTVATDGDADGLRKHFLNLLAEAKIPRGNATIVCRGNEGVKKWRGDPPTQGQGTTAIFAKAAVIRDQASDFKGAFDLAVRGFIQLLEDPPGDLLTKLRNSRMPPALRAFSRLIWKFVRSDDGLPSASLKAASGWHPLLVARVKAVLAELNSTCGLATVSTIGPRLNKTNLDDEPLMVGASSLAVESGIRVETVHGVKGESIQAVMYVATKGQIDDLLAGPVTEIGRIGYVAVTRAQDLFLLTVPEKDAQTLRPLLVARGFVERPLPSP
ncbi:ATP-dependent helicase [Neorhizobium galegae]|nr:ATP-dependent helicase [Neorhizobium galegae]